MLSFNFGESPRGTAIEEARNEEDRGLSSICKLEHKESYHRDNSTTFSELKATGQRRARGTRRQGEGKILGDGDPGRKYAVIYRRDEAASSRGHERDTIVINDSLLRETRGICSLLHIPFLGLGFRFLQA